MASPSDNNSELYIEQGQAVHQDSAITVNDTASARLDADMYTAEDLDGVTEGLFGSGNLNYLVMQSQQANEAAMVNDPFAFRGIGDGGVGAVMDDGKGAGFGDAASRAADGGLGRLAGAERLSGNRSGGGEGHGDVNGLNAHGAGSGSLNSIESSTASVGGSGGGGGGGGGGSASSGANGSDGTDGNEGPGGDDGSNGPGGNDGNNGSNGNDGQDGTDGTNPGGGGGGDDTDLSLDLGTGVLDGNLDVVLDTVEAITGDLDIDIVGIVGNILGGGLLDGTGITGDADHNGGNLLGIDTAQVTEPLNENLTETVSNVLTATDTVLDSVTSIVPEPLQGLVPTVDTLLGGVLNGNGGDPDLQVGLLGNLGGQGDGGLTLDVPLDVVESLFGDIDITSGNGLTLSDINGDDLLGTALPTLQSALDISGDILPGIGAGADSNDLMGSVGGVLDDVGGLDAADLANGLLDGLANDTPLSEAIDDITQGLMDGDIGDFVPDAGQVMDVVDDISGVILDDSGVGGLAESIIGGLGSDTPVADTVEVVTQPVQDAADQLMDIVQDIGGTTPVGGVVDDLLGGMDSDAPVQDAVDQINDTVQDVVDNLGAGDPVIDLVDGVTDGLGDAPVQDVVDQAGDLIGGLLGGGGDESAAAFASDGDTDLNVGIDLDVAGLDTGDLGQSINLDPVEDILGDIDIDVGTDAVAGLDGGSLGDIIDGIDAGLGMDADLDVLGDINDGDGIELGGSLDDVLGDVSWPEASVTDGIDDAVGGLLGGGDASLPDPGGVISDGLAALGGGSSSGGGSLGGGLLGGGGHSGGGLFGGFGH